MSEYTKVPSQSLRLEWAYGYRGKQSRCNVKFTSSNEVVYFVAAIGIVYNVEKHSQRFYFEHNDDILCICLHPNGFLIATGEIGESPVISVWNCNTLQTRSLLQNGHKDGVIGLDFNQDGDRLVSAGMDKDYTINVWDWEKGKLLATASATTDKLIDIQYNPYSPGHFVTCGLRHIKFWSHCGNALTSKKGIFGPVGPVQTLISVAFMRDGNAFAGSLAGDVCVFEGHVLKRVIPSFLKSTIFHIFSCEEGFAIAGKSPTIKMVDHDLEEIGSFDMLSVDNGRNGMIVKSVFWKNDTLLLGLQTNEIFLACLKPTVNVTTVTQGHPEGDVWALAVHPNKQIAITGSDSCSLIVWDIKERAIIKSYKTQSAIRSLGYNPNGELIAVGMVQGICSIIRSADLSLVSSIKSRKDVIHELKFSPDGKYLAVGSHDNFVDIYAVDQNFKKVGECVGNCSFITHLDWSVDGKFLQTNSGQREHRYYEMPSGTAFTSKSAISEVQWNTWTGVLGAEVAGIWDKYSEVSDVNSADVLFEDEVLVTGDDFGLVKLFNFPTPKKGAKYKRYIGHSSQVTNVRFTADRRHVMSTGEDDNAVLQWRYLGEDEEKGPGQPMGSDMEASDSDMSDVPQLDSDLERENEVSYSRSKKESSPERLQKSNSNSGKKRLRPPVTDLELFHVNGYRGYDCRNNAFYLTNGNIVFHVAAVGIVVHKSSGKQSFYTSHTDDILCLAIHPTKDLVATGQVGKNATVHVWNAESKSPVSILEGGHTRGVCAVDFSSDGRRLASVGLDDNHCIVIWDWKKGEQLANARGHKDKIFSIRWNPVEQSCLVSVGIKHIKFWSVTGGGLTSRRGTFGSVGKLVTMCCALYSNDGKVCYSGGDNGQLYVWKDLALTRTVKAHEGPCFSLFVFDKGFISGGKDGLIKIWNQELTEVVKEFELSGKSTELYFYDSRPAIRSVATAFGCILAGTRNGEVVEFDKFGELSIIVQGHSEGEVWGLSCSASKSLYVTVSDDRTLRLWSYAPQNKLIRSRKLKHAARCVSFSPNGDFAAVGFVNGSFTIFKVDSMDEFLSMHHRKEEISDIKFSPGAAKYLAVASHDNFIDIYNVMNETRVGVCKGASSYITHIDWDVNGKLLMVNSGAREQLFFEAPRGKRQTLNSDNIVNHEWEDWTCVLGSNIEGIWPPKCDITDINACHLSHDKTRFVTADDFGFVKMFSYPVTGKFARFKRYSGHSAHVGNIKWSHDDSHVISVGGADTSIMVWRCGADDANIACNDSDDEDSEGFDSDVDREKNIDFASKTYCVRSTEGVKPHLQIYEEKKVSSLQRFKPQSVQVASRDFVPDHKKPLDKITDLFLDCVLGYRGYDCRNNLHYVNDGEDIVYHAAALCIVNNISTGIQSFYTEHDDDVICLTINKNSKFKGVVASGQVGKHPAIFVWDVNSKETLSVLKGKHRSGVCFLDFSSSGRYLASLGLDDQHMISVWHWQQAYQVACVPCSLNRVFVVMFRPDSDSLLVSAGVKHLAFWSLAGSTLIKKSPRFPADKPSLRLITMLAIAFGPDNQSFTGAISGDVYVWKDAVYVRQIAKVHNGPVFTLFTTLKDGLMVSGGKDKNSKDGGAVKLWDQEMRRCKGYHLSNLPDKVVVKSVFRARGKILVGTSDADIVEIDERRASSSVIMSGHGAGEFWGLSAHPSKNLAVSASEDGSAIIWDFVTKRMENKIRLPWPARSACFNSDGDLFAVGSVRGEVIIYDSSTLRPFAKKRDRNKIIHVVRFSPDGRFLAVGSDDCAIDIYDVTKGASLPKITSCKGISSFAYIIDFSTDSRYIKIGTGNYIPYIYEVDSGNVITDQEVINSITWYTWTSVLGIEVLGIWGKDSASADVNCASVNTTSSPNCIVTGDDFGNVKLFNFPCSEKFATCKVYKGHSAHVTNVQFTRNDRYLLSAGGDDNCLFVWKTK